MPLPSFVPGFRPTDGTDLNSILSELFSTQNGVTAKAGGGASAAVQLNSAVTEVSVCASANDSVMLPSADFVGKRRRIINNGAQTLAVFAAQGTNPITNSLDTITPNTSVTPTVNASAVTVATVKISEFVVFKLGQWKQSTTA